VHVGFREKFRRLVSLKELQAHREAALKDMQALRQSRLSVSRVSKAEWDFILELAREGEEEEGEEEEEEEAGELGEAS